MPDPETDDDRLRLDLFGAFRVTAATGRPAHISSRRARALLAYLSVARHLGETRERLAGLLWSDRAEEQARASLRQCLLELRAGLLDVGRERVSLRADRFSSDLAMLRRTLSDDVQADGPRHLAEGLQAIGVEPLLADLQLGGLFGEWLDQTRGQLEGDIAAAAHRRLQAAEAAGDWSGVRTLAEAFLRRQPLDETAVAAAMRADAAQGISSAAHRRFRILEAALAKEYGVRPGSAARDALAALHGPGPATVTAIRSSPAPARADPDPHAPPLLVITEFHDAGLEAADSGLVRPVREEVVSGLSRFRDLRIITDPHPQADTDARTWAERGAAYVLGGALRPSLDGLKLTVQLLRTGDGRVVWSDAFGVPGARLVHAIDRIIAQVVGAVLPMINQDLVLQARMPANDTYLRYLSARDAAASPPSHDHARVAAADLEALIADAPGFVLPYLPLARLYNTDFGYTRAGSSGADEFSRAFDLAKTALSVDRGHVHGYTVAGWCHLRRRQWDVARLHFDQAVELNPFHAERLVEAGFGHIMLGETDRARALLDRSLLLNPAPRDDFFADLGLLELVTGDHERAANYFELIARPTVWDLIHAAVNASLGGQSDRGKAQAAAKAIAGIWPRGEETSIEALVAWIADHSPFRDVETEARFLGGARSALVQAGWPPGP